MNTSLSLITVNSLDSSKTIVFVERERERERESNPYHQVCLLLFTSTIQSFGISILIHSFIIESMKNSYASLFKLYQSFCKICFSFSQKHQSFYKTYLSSPFPYQSSHKLNQTLQETIRKQYFLIGFCDFQLELSKNNWKREGLNWKRKGNTLQTGGNNWNAKGLIKNTTGLIWKPLLMTNYE